LNFLSYIFIRNLDYFISFKGHTETREKKKKESVYINFIDLEDWDERMIFSPGGSKMNAPKLAEKVSHGHLLPDDMHFSSKKLQQLFLKPQFMVIINLIVCFS
jgi:Condensin complex subunit 2